MKKLFFLLLFPLLSFYSYGQACGPERIIGVVLDAETNEPIKNIQVNAHMSKGKYNDETFTNNKGEFEIRLKTGNYFVIINKDRSNKQYEYTKVTDIQVKSWSTTDIEILVKPIKKP